MFNFSEVNNKEQLATVNPLKTAICCFTPYFLYRLNKGDNDLISKL